MRASPADKELRPITTAHNNMHKRLLCLPLLMVMSQPVAEQIVLEKDRFEHVHFRRIQPTIVDFDQGTVAFEVNDSSSFLLLAFDSIRAVQKVSFEWQADGVLNKHSATEERSRQGDDAWLRIGLIISGEPEPVPLALLPRWMKQVRNTLRFASDKMIYLIPDARHAPGEIWSSPFSSAIDMVSVPSKPMDDDWKRVSFTFSEAQQTVGLWLMADGDNTNSQFRSRLRNLVID
jgi:hypothetical protein